MGARGGIRVPHRRRKVMLAACFSRWLGQQAVSVCRVSSEHAVRYLRSRAHHVKIQPEDAGTLRQFLDFLRRQGVVPAKKIPPPRLTPVEQAIHAFASAASRHAGSFPAPVWMWVSCRRSAEITGSRRRSESRHHHGSSGKIPQRSLGSSRLAPHEPLAKIRCPF